MEINDVKVTSNKEEILAEKEEAIKQILEAIGIQAEGDIVEVVTAKHIVDTGRLRDSITYVTAHKRDKVRGVARSGDEVPGTPDENTVYVGTNVDYAVYQEFGTSRQKARPFVKPGVMNNISKYKQIMKKYLG